MSSTQAKTDHADLVSSRMGFILLPLACLVRGVWSSGCGLVIGGWTVSVIAYYRVIIIDVFVQLWDTLYQTFTFPGRNGAILFVVLYLW